MSHMLRNMIERAANAQVDEHNGDKPEGYSEKAIKRANRQAKKEGVLLDWRPGIYPQYRMVGEEHWRAF